MFFTLHSPYLPGAFCSSLFTHLIYNLDGCLLLVTLSTVSSVLPSNSYSFLSISTWLAVAFCSSLSLSTIYMVASCYSLSLQYCIYLVPLTLPSPYLPGCLLLLTFHSLYLQSTCYSLFLQYLLYLVPLPSPYLPGCILLFTLHSPYLQATWLPPAIHSLYSIYCT